MLVPQWTPNRLPPAIPMERALSITASECEVSSFKAKRKLLSISSSGVGEAETAAAIAIPQNGRPKSAQQTAFMQITSLTLPAIPAMAKPTATASQQSATTRKTSARC